MAFGLVIGTLLMAQASVAFVPSDSEGLEVREVAYGALSAGEARDAVQVLEALRVENPNDPALLINLGSAYAALGDIARAEECYREAETSEIRYQLELADGTWVDSRRAARMALRNLESNALALN